MEKEAERVAGQAKQAAEDKIDLERKTQDKQEKKQEAQQQASVSSSGSQPAETSNPPQEPDSKQKEQEDQEEEKPASTFSVSEKGLHFIGKHEGWQPRIYGDPAPKSYPTILWTQN